MGGVALALALAANGSLSGEVRAARLDRSGVVVWVEGFDEPAPSAHAEVHQCGKRFVPELSFVRAGQYVDFVNDDGLTHNVFSTSAHVDMGRASPNTRVSHQFKNAGVVDLFCDVHEEMRGTLFVLTNGAVTLTGPDGKFSFDKIPAGRRTVVAWQRDGAPAKTEVVVEAGKRAEAVLELAAPAIVAAHLDRHQRPYAEHPVQYRTDGGLATSCPEPAGALLAQVAPPGIDAGTASPSTQVNRVMSKAQLLRDAAALLERAEDARRTGDLPTAERYFSSAEGLIGQDALADIASTFLEGAPPRVSTPLKQMPLDAPPQPAAVGDSDADTPHPKPERGSLTGQLMLGDRPIDVRAVVTLEPSGGGGKKPSPQERVIEQRQRQFAPRLMVVPVGSTVAFPNYDPIFHNVFSRSEVQPFDLGLFRNGQSREVTFSKPGVFRLGCNLHPNMSAYVLVVSEPHYAVVDGSGRFSFKRLKPGKYVARAWSESTREPVKQEVQIKPGANAVTLSLSADAPAGNPDKFGVPR
jgi:plastocyanin